MEILIAIIVIYFIYALIKSSDNKKQKRAPSELTVRIEVSDPYDKDTEPYKRPSGKPAKWHPPGQATQIQGYDISGGMIYVGESLPDSYGYRNDSCLINPKLKAVPAEPWEGGDEMGYWPQYERIPKKCRGAYLKWLADGREEPETNIGYVFLFFYGLERRLFIDGQAGGIPPEERAAIVNEIVRLLKIYGENRSFERYASTLLAMEWVLYNSDKPVPSYLDFNDRYCSQPFQVVLARHVNAGQPIPAEIALQWIKLHPDFGLRTPARRCSREFKQLFAHRYALQFGDGLIVKPNKTPLKLEYHAANSSIHGITSLNGPDLPNPFILTRPLKKLSALVEQCTTDLEPYSRFLGRKNNSPTSLAALALLPKELISEVPIAKELHQNLKQVCATGIGLLSIEQLYKSVGEKVPQQWGKRESESLASLVEGVGFGLAPDVRFHHIKPNVDGKVAIFPNGHGIDFQPSKEFQTLVTILRLGAIISLIDNELSPSEESTLQGLINDNRNLTQIEKESLLAFLHWCLSTPQNVTGIKQKLGELSTAENTAIGHILITVAFADGRIDPNEIKQLEKFYVTLGLDKEQVTKDLHAVAATEPVTVGLRDKITTHPIPKKQENSKTDGAFHLDQELIRIREEETRQVKGVLEEIFSDPVEELDSAHDLPSSHPNSPLVELDQAHQDLFHRLIAHETWERHSLQDLCKELGLMLDGALEVLNEWAFENANAPLIDDGDPVFVDINLAKEIISDQ